MYKRKKIGQLFSLRDNTEPPKMQKIDSYLKKLQGGVGWESLLLVQDGNNISNLGILLDKKLANSPISNYFQDRQYRLLHAKQIQREKNTGIVKTNPEVHLLQSRGERVVVLDKDHDGSIGYIASNRESLG